jgi:hypothetical protein
MERSGAGCSNERIIATTRRAVIIRVYSAHVHTVSVVGRVDVLNHDDEAVSSSRTSVIVRRGEAIKDVQAKVPVLPVEVGSPAKNHGTYCPGSDVSSAES